MSMTRLGSFTPIAANPVDGSLTATPTLTVPAGGIPVGSTIIIGGVIGSSSMTFSSIADNKGNIWNVRQSAVPGMFLADCKVTTALVSGDTVVITLSAVGAFYTFLGVWYDNAYYDTSATSTWTGTAAAGPAITTTNANELVLGFFGVHEGGSTAIPTLTAAGSGYTDETGGGAGQSPG